MSRKIAFRAMLTPNRLACRGLDIHAGRGARLAPMLSLSSLRAAAAFAAAATLGGGINDSTSNHSHLFVTYLFWYGVSGLLVATTVAATVVIERRKRRALDNKSTPLQRWLEARLAEQESIARERSVRGDHAYLQRIGEWDVQNVTELLGERAADGHYTGVAPELVDDYRGNPPGFPAPGTVEQQDAYYMRQVNWLRDTLQAIRNPALSERDRRIKALEFNRLQHEFGGRGVLIESGTEGPNGIVRRNVPCQGRSGHFVDMGVRPLAVCVRSPEEKVPFDPVEVREPPLTVPIGYGGTVTVRSFEDRGIVIDEANALPKQYLQYEVIERA
jgi:hypothetical protein